MEKVARRYEATSSHLQDQRAGSNYTASLRIDDDILTRIRSLLASRNHQHSPRTPLPTPDYSSYPRGVDENTSSYFHSGTANFDFSSAKTVAKLARNGSRKTSMVVKQFDGPAGQSEASSTGSFRRHPSDPGLDMDRSVSAGVESLGTTPGLDQKALGNNLGRGHQRSVDPAVIRPTKLSVPAKNQGYQQLRFPRFLLRTVPPANPQLTEARLRPSIHHVPGSYRSELDHNVDGEIVMPSHSPLGDALSVNDDARSVSQVSGEITYVPELPVEDQHGTMEPKHASIRSMDSRSVLSRKSSLRTTRSAASIGPVHHHILHNPSADPMTSSSPVPPLLTSELDHGNDDGDEQPLLQSFPAFYGPGDNEQLKPSLEEQPTASTAAPPVDAEGPQLLDLLSQLPPLKQSSVDDFKGHHLTTTSEASTLEVPSTAKPSFEYRSEQSGNSNSLGGSARHSLHSLNAGYSNHVTGLSLSELDSRQQGIATSQSGLSRVPSIHTRAMPRLSPMSSRSTLQTKSSKGSLRHGTDVFTDEATRLIKPPSLPSMDDSVSTDHGTNDARLAYQRRLSHHAYRAGDSGESGRTTHVHGQQSDSQKHWVRQLLRRGTDKASSPDSSHLTARPFHRKRRAPTQPGDRNLANFIPLAEDDQPRDKGSSLQANEGHNTQSSITEGLDKQMKAESFAKVILDLETLLNEALSVARHAADKENTENIPAISEEASRVLKNESASNIISSNNPDHSSLRDQSATTASPHVVGDYYSDASASSSDSEDLRWHVEDGLQSANKRKEHVIIIEPDDEALHSGHFRKVRDSTPYPLSPAAVSRQVSMVPEDVASKAVLLRTRNDAQSMSMIQEQLPELNIGQGPAQPPKCDDVAPVPGSRQMFTAIQTPPRFYDQTDWAYSHEQRQPRKTLSVTQPLLPTRPTSVKAPSKEETRHIIRENRAPPNVPSSEDVQNYIVVHNQPPIQPRISSAGLRSRAFPAEEAASMTSATDLKFSHHSDGDAPDDTLRSPGLDSLSDYQQSSQSRPNRRSGPPHHDTITSLRPPQPQRRESSLHQEMTATQNEFSLRDRHHYSLREPHGFSLSRSHRRAPIARDWGTTRKRFVAAVACISTALLGLIVGIYAGEVPAIQYSLADEHHYTILGNVFFYLGLAIPTVLFWPLPLLHGRKPYTLIALALLLPLQFPQAIVVGTPRSPYVARYRMGLLFSRAISGIVMGFANVNFKTTLLDLFGASLQSGNPHEEIVNENDVRRHGGGMGVWLGIWTWCFIGSIGVGFLIGALIISGLTVDWGFYITVILIAFVLFLNVLTPEVRRSPYRRSVAEVRTSTDISRRIARGEIMMHLKSTGPVWWWEEVIAGQVLCIRMLKQPGFVVLSLYMGWIYGQIVMVIVLLGALISKYYRFHPQYVGLCVFAIPLGALLAIPFQKASFFSRSRHHAARTDSMTFQKRVTWTSHLLRRAIFMIVLPFAGMAYTLASAGPPIHFMVPTVFAGLIGFLSNLAIAECHGIIMETYDTSDLQPGMTGKPRNDVPESVRRKRSNFSSYPRVTAGFAIAQAFAFLIAAAATGAGGAIERKLGAQTATAVVAIVLLILTILLIGVLWRFKEVQVVPTDRFGTGLSLSGEEPWRPVIIGNPSGRMRRMSLLELGKQSRWSEIRRKNKLTGLQ